MSNNAYLLNLTTESNNPYKTPGEWLEVAEAIDTIPFAWLCMFDESDLKPYDLCYYTSVRIDGEKVRIKNKTNIAIPVTSVSKAIERLKKAKNIFLIYASTCGDALVLWEMNLSALAALPHPYISMQLDDFFQPFEYSNIHFDNHLSLDFIQQKSEILKLSLSQQINTTQTKEMLSNINVHDSETIFIGLDAGIDILQTYRIQTQENSQKHIEMLTQLEQTPLIETPQGFKPFTMDLRNETPPDFFWQNQAFIKLTKANLKIEHGKSLTSKKDRQYYATKLTNIGKQALRIKMFAGFRKEHIEYKLSTISGQWFSANNFKSWYQVDESGWIAPGESVMDRCNFGHAPDGLWAFWCETQDHQHFMAAIPLPTETTIPQTVLTEPKIVQMMQTKAEKLRQSIYQQISQLPNYDRDTVGWIDRYINQQKTHISEEKQEKLIDTFAALLGECICQTHGATWIEQPEFGIGVYLEGNVFFPKHKIAKQFNDKTGEESAESVLSFFDVIPMLSSLKTPQQNSEMSLTIEYMRQELNEARNTQGVFQHTYWQIEAPPNFPKNDDLQVIFRSYPQLLTQGKIVWAAIIQANSWLFKPGNLDLPAAVVYAPNNLFDENPDKLCEIAEQLFTLKQTGVNASHSLSEARLIELLQHELDRGLDTNIPSSLTSGHHLKFTSIMIFRKHLPRQLLDINLVPLLIHQDSLAAMILPAKLWPEKFRGPKPALSLL